MSGEFTNWSGSLRCTPSAWPRPAGTEDLAGIVERAREQGRTVRPVGSGHSSSPLVVTDDVMVSLEDMAGVVSADPDAGRATLLPGTGLSELGGQLAASGLALENFGDVDYQTIAGSIGTGTHGTGRRLGNLSSMLVGGTLVTGTGEVVPFGVEAGPDADPDGGPVADDGPGGGPARDPADDLLRAAQVSLGALGVFASMTLRVRPAYDLHRLNWMTHVDWVMDHFQDLVEQNRNVDFYWYPRSDLAQVRMLNEPGHEPALMPPGTLRKDVTGPSYEIIPNHREIRFEEMEYMLPLEAGMEAFDQVRRRIKDRHRAMVGWRVLVRTIAPDRAMLSNAQDRPTMTIALLQNASLPYAPYFDDMEPMLRDFGGRPHWGKKHTMTARQLSGLYPEWDAFQRMRHRLDPDGVFLNPYLRELLGVPSTTGP